MPQLIAAMLGWQTLKSYAVTVSCFGPWPYVVVHGVIHQLHSQASELVQARLLIAKGGSVCEEVANEDWLEERAGITIHLQQPLAHIAHNDTTLLTSQKDLPHAW